MIVPGGPSLDLAVEVTLADGTRVRWDAASRADSVPQGLTFNTKQGTGFAEATITLARRIDRDYLDLNLYDGVVIAGTDGDVAYEGMVGALPRSLQSQHSISAQLTGWMAAATLRKFQEVFVDRSFGSWGQSPLNARIEQTATLGRDFDASYSWSVDGQALSCSLPNQALGPQCEAIAWYTAPSAVTVSRIEYAGTATTIPGGYLPSIGISPNDSGTSSEGYTATLDGVLRGINFTNRYRYALIDLYSNGNAATPLAGSMASYNQIAVFGNSGVTIRPSLEPGVQASCVYASDVIANLASRFVPELSIAGVQPSSYPISHLVYADRTAPYDAFLDVNKYEIRQLNVWEDRTLFYEPYPDLDDYDWEIRTDDEGTAFELQGDTTESLANGVAVTFTNVETGLVEVVDPTTNPNELLDPSIDNPATLHGIQDWLEVPLSFPTVASDAVQFGRIALADNNQPKAPGTITVQGHIRDRAGHWQPVWKVRAGDRIAITNHPDDRPRRIVETSYTHDTRSLQIGVDSTLQRTPTLLDRISTALAANNISV